MYVANAFLRNNFIYLKRLSMHKILNASMPNVFVVGPNPIFSLRLKVTGYPLNNFICAKLYFRYFMLINVIQSK